MTKRRQHPRARIALAASLLSLFVTGWVLFAPTNLGGQASYAVVSGNSMEPGLHAGDLAVVRSNSRYENGDVVVYHHPAIGPVIHRIVGRDGDRYTTRGDHNTFIDPYHPAAAEVRGRLWFHVPAIGRWFMLIRSPQAFAAIAVIALASWGASSAVKLDDTARAGAPALAATGHFARKYAADVASVAVVAAATAAVLGALAFTRPMHRQATHETAYAQHVMFDYAASASQPEVYDGAGATSGEPVFRRLSDKLAVTFAYSIDSGSAPVTASAEYELVAEVRDRTGWKRSVTLASGHADSVPFAATANIDLQQLQSFIDRMEAETGEHNPDYSVVISPRMATNAVLDGEALVAQFSPRLEMMLDPISLRLANPSPEGRNPLVFAEAATATSKHREANTVSLVVVRLPVSTARWVSIGILGMLTAASGALMVSLNRAAPAGAQMSPPIEPMQTPRAPRRKPAGP